MLAPMRGALLSSTLVLAACVSSGDRSITVKHVVENARALDGQVIVVRGWIEGCQRLSCVLYGSPRDVRKEWPYYLSIGPSDWFDVIARRRGPGHITLRARLHDRCIDDPATRAITVCADRPTTLEPLSVVQ